LNRNFCSIGYGGGGRGGGGYGGSGKFEARKSLYSVALELTFGLIQ